MNDRLCLEELPESEFTPFPTIAGHFITAERSFRIYRGTIDKDHAGLDPRGYFGCALLAGGLHISGQPVDRVIRN